MDARIAGIIVFILLFAISILFMKKENPKISKLLFILSAIVGIVNFFSFILFPQPDYEKLKEDIIREIDESLQEFSIDLRCTEFKKPIIKDGAIYIDKCVIMFTELNLPSYGYVIDLKFRSNWKNSDSKHTIVFVSGDDSEIHLYEYMGSIYFVTKSEGKISGVYSPIKELNWIDESFGTGWNEIKVLWNSEEGKIWLEVNGNRIIGEMKSNLNFEKSKLYLGSCPYENSYAEGYFDRMTVYKAADPVDVSGFSTGVVTVGIE